MVIHCHIEVIPLLLFTQAKYVAIHIGCRDVDDITSGHIYQQDIMARGLLLSLLTGINRRYTLRDTNMTVIFTLVIGDIVTEWSLR